MIFWVTFATIVCVLVVRWFRKTTKDVGKYEARGLHAIKPGKIHGCSNISWITERKSFMEIGVKLYKDLSGQPLGVIYDFWEPVILLRDPDLIKEVLVKQFDCFTDRRVMKELTEVHKEISLMLTSLTGEEWRRMRNRLSPAFTANRLKPIVDTINKSAKPWTEYLRATVDKETGEIDMDDAFTRLSLDVIARAVFGVDAGTYQREEPEFITFAKKSRDGLSLKLVLFFLVYRFAPSVAKALKLRLMNMEPIHFFRKVAADVISRRRESGERQKDMLQVLVDLQSETPDQGITEEAIVQSAHLFLLGGFETTARSLSLISYHLACHQDVQDRARQEILKVMSDGISYEHLSELKYLEAVINESFRKTPVGVINERMCTQDCVLSNGVTVDKGTRVQVSLVGLHLDPDHWKDPEQFDPERFLDDKINPFVFSAFGAGPRNCIGQRFAWMELKVTICHLLKEFTLEPGPRTKIPLEFEPSQMITTIKGGTWLRLIPRSS